MDRERIEQVEGTALPEPLRAALKELALALEPVLPSLSPHYPQSFVSSMLSLVVRETASPKTEPHG